MASDGFEAVIGLEVHAQLRTESKIFCGCSTRFGEQPNRNTCPVCLGMPGVLPVLNRKAVEYALMAALALNCEIPPRSVFARKNYFYPDLPKGYQISQYEFPLAVRGWLEIPLREGGKKRVGISRIHLEEDAGKLIHGEGAESGVSYIDYNRSGVPLLEIVSEPDLRTPEEAGSYLRQLANILVFLKVCDGKMEEGSLRCDANVSIRRMGEKALGVKTEVKNLNSFRNVERALKREVERQVTVIREGGKVIQETLLWDPEKEITLPMRTKEEAHDYRYFPDPDLLPLWVSESWIEEIKGKIPELPLNKMERYVKEFDLPEYDAEVLSSSRPVAEFFEACVQLFPEPKKVSNWIMVEILRLMKESNWEEIRIKPETMVKVIRLVEQGTISHLMGKRVLEESSQTGKDPEQIIRDQGLVQISDEIELGDLISQVVRENPEEVRRYRQGEERLHQFLVGQVMKKSRGKANPKRVGELIKSIIKGE